MKYRKITGLLMLAFLTLAQESCLKDNANNTNPAEGSNNVVEFQNSSIPVSYTSIYPQYSNGIILANDTGGFPVNLNYTGAVSVAPADIKITLAIDTAALDSFNTNQGTSYVLPPPDTYTISLTPTIAKGTRQTSIHVSVNVAPTDYDYSASYALPLTISGASYGVISSNFGTAIYSFIARNKYDGSYSFREKLVGWGAYSIDDGGTYNWPNNVGFVTSGQSSNTTYENGVGYGSLQLAFTATGGATGFGATMPQFTFDPATDALVSVTNLTPNDGRGRAFAINPAVTDSRWDASTGTIYLAYEMFQIGRPTQYIYDTLVYKGTR
jgi:hypothetical protein